MAQPVGRQPSRLEIQAAEEWVRAHPGDPLPPEGEGRGELLAVPRGILEAVQRCWDASIGGVSLNRAMEVGDDFIATLLAAEDPGFRPTGNLIRQSAEKGMRQFLNFQLSKADSDPEMQETFQTELEHAAKNGQLGTFRLLRDSGVKETSYALMFAAGQGWLSEVRAMVNAGVVIYSSALGFAASGNHLDVYLFLIKQGARPSGYLQAEALRAVYEADLPTYLKYLEQGAYPDGEIFRVVAWKGWLAEVEKIVGVYKVAVSPSASWSALYHSHREVFSYMIGHMKRFSQAELLKAIENGWRDEVIRMIDDLDKFPKKKKLLNKLAKLKNRELFNRVLDAGVIPNEETLRNIPSEWESERIRVQDLLGGGGGAGDAGPA